MPQQKKNGFGCLPILLLAALAICIRFGFPSLQTNQISLPESGFRSVASVNPAPADSGTFDALYAPYYAQLSASEQTVYRQLYQAVTDCAESFDPQAEMSIESLKKVSLAVSYDQPQLFWWEGSFSYSSYEYAPDIPVEVRPIYNDLANDLETHQQEFDTAAQQLLSSAASMQRPQDRELYIHDTLIDLVTYTDNAAYSQTAYSALVNHETVCAGYTRAFQYLMMQLDIPCYYCAGTAAESESLDPQTHSWNIIQLNGNFYNIDVTWDDNESSGFTSYVFFNRTDSFFENQLHIRAQEGFALPSCDSTECSLENLFGAQPMIDSLSDYGISSNSITYDLNGYYQFCEQQLIAAGSQTGTLYCLVHGEQTMDAISALSSEDMNAGYLNTVFQTAFPYGSSYSHSLTSYLVGDEYYFLSQDYTFR
ncbi:MAG: hypothetical protein Q4D42_04510 [Eubacteriales bacterium]|nr:hypothetical protein [Eubacteriales bacterium]